VRRAGIRLGTVAVLVLADTREQPFEIRVL
jgi:hypothetical protein